MSVFWIAWNKPLLSDSPCHILKHVCKKKRFKGRLVGLFQHCSRRLIVRTLVFSLSYLHCHVAPPETLVVKGGTTWARNGRWIFPENARLPRNIQGFLHAVNLRHGTKGFTSLPKEGVLRSFFALKNPTAPAEFEPANLGYQRPARYLYCMQLSSPICVQRPQAHWFHHSNNYWYN